MSFCATSGLLTYLAYSEYRASRGHCVSSIHTQGFFWLVNLFIAGKIPIADLRLIFRFNTIVFRTSSGELFASQCDTTRTLLHSPRSPSQLWGYCFGNLVICHCFAYYSVSCWRAQIETMGCRQECARK